MVDTIKFSEMPNAGNINNNDIMPSLRSGENVILNNPWTFLPPGTTAERPAPSSTINYRLRLNTTDQLYEYYDAVLGLWTQLQESAFTQGPFITYTADATLPDAQNLGILADGILKQTITLGVATLDIAVNGTDFYGPGFVIPPADGGTGVNNGALTIILGGATTGFVLTSDSSGNATWQSVSASGGITTIDGDSGSATALAGVITISGASTGLTFIGASHTVSLGGLLNSTYGGLGVSNPTAHGILIGEGASPVTPIVLGAGQILIGTTSGDPVAAAIGSGTNILVGNSSGAITIGITGIIAIANGGTGVSSVTVSPTATAWAGWDANKNLSANNFPAAYTTTATAAGTTTLTVASTYAQFFTGSTTQILVLPVTSTLALGFPFYVVNNSSGNVTIESSGGNSIQVMAPGTTAYLTCILTSGTTASSWNCEYAFNGGTGSGTVNSGTSGQLTYYAATGTAVSGLTTGTGVVTALGGNIGTAGSFITNGGALGTPSSGNMSNLTGLTNAQLPAINYNLSLSCGAFTGSAASATPITNLSASLTTVGRPVMLMLIPDGTANNAYVYSGAVPTITIYFYKGVTLIGQVLLNSGGAGGLPPGLITVDTTVVGSPGTYTWTAQYSITSGTASINYYKLIAIEI